MCLRGGMGGRQMQDDSVRLKCDDECTAMSRLRAFASVVGKEGHQSTGKSGDPAACATKYTEFLLQFAEREPAIVQYIESEFSRIVLGKTKKVSFEGFPELHRLVVHTLSDLYSLESESTGRPPNRILTVRHRGAGMKPVFPRRLLSQALVIREREKRRSKQLRSGKTLIIHVASSTRYSATTQIEARVESQLRSHAGYYHIRGRTTMSSNLTGVSVEFSTPERAMLVRTSLMARDDVTVEAPEAARLGSSSSGLGMSPTPHETLASAAESQSWNDGIQYSARETLRNGLPAPPPQVLVDENVPDSWDD